MLSYRSCLSILRKGRAARDALTLKQVGVMAPSMGHGKCVMVILPSLHKHFAQGSGNTRHGRHTQRLSTHCRELQLRWQERTQPVSVQAITLCNYQPAIRPCIPQVHAVSL